MRRLTFALTLALSIGSTGAADLTSVSERLRSESAGDRVSAIRMLVTLKAPPATARPLLAPLIRDRSEAVRAELASAVSELLDDGGIDLLEELTRDAQAAVRESSVRAVCRMWSRSRARVLCVRSFEDPDSRVRKQVLQTLRARYPRDRAAASLFRSGLGDSSPSVQRAAVLGCQAAGDESAVPFLLEVARTASDLAAVPAAEEALATIASPRAIEGLLSLLDASPATGADSRVPSPEVRAAAARALARIGAPGAAQALRARLEDREVPVVLSAIEGLLGLQDRSSVSDIIRTLSHTDVRVRRYALLALRNFRDPSSADEVRRVMLTDREPLVRAGAVLTYADILGPAAIPHLGSLSDDADAGVRLEAVGALAGLGKPACAALASFVGDSSASVQALAIAGIGQTRDPAQIAALSRAARSPDPEVRAALARALGHIGSMEGLSLLLRLAADSDQIVRADAAAALGRLRTPEARQTLERLLRDSSSRVRSAAARALQRLNRTAR